jgi:hypothetical protein
MHRAGLSLLVLGLIAVAGAYALVFADIAFHAAPWLLALGTTAVLAGMVVLGIARRGRAAPVLTLATVVCFASVAIGLAVPLMLPAPTASDPLLLGLPRPTTILLLLAGLLPLVLLPVMYAIAFEREVLSQDDLAAIRDERAAP